MAKLIYVVDDQAAVLETAVFVLENIDPAWQVVGFNSPIDALAAARQKAPDMVLSDQIMPKMQGSQLLEEIRLILPTTIRIIMSGYVEMGKLSLITSAHQYIAKPFDAVGLRDLVLRAFAGQEKIQNSGLQQVVAGLKSVPSLPQVYHSLLAELEDQRGASTAIARLVSQDPGLSAKVLQLANSSLFGHGYLINHPMDAVMCLGTEMIKAIVLSQAIFKHYATLKHPEFDLGKLWAHSWDVAQYARYCCRDKKLPPALAEQAFLAGLLHEVGRLILVESFPEQFQAACATARSKGVSLCLCLRETFKATPAQVSGYLLDLWGMPGEVIAAVSKHDCPENAAGQEFELTTALYVGDYLASKKAPADAFALPELNTQYLKATGCLDELPEWEQLQLAPAANGAG
jgi:HD-like signal output (HDOD) protein